MGVWGVTEKIFLFLCNLWKKSANLFKISLNSVKNVCKMYAKIETGTDFTLEMLKKLY